jgi:hypothetical protein
VCKPNTFGSGGTCQHCGGTGELCCSGNSCTSGTCSGGTCQTCGLRGQPCCNGVSCSQGICQAGRCQ